MGGSTAFLRWLESFASLDLNTSHGNASLLLQEQLRHREKPLENRGEVGDRLVQTPIPPLGSFLWLNP
jgi:hypothetical protein